MPEAFTFFWKSPLSQWHRAPFVVGGTTFTHAEQYMMYAKALLFGDRDAAARVLAAETPAEQQAIGRTVRGFDESVWAIFREAVVFMGNYARFSQNSEQRELLFATRGTTLVVASPHDRVWGTVTAMTPATWRRASYTPTGEWVARLQQTAPGSL